ncbi:hypothetical protein BHQ23_21245 [Mycobacterium gordonae]|nr:hypothetical protein BHQ23_21245 [Mycobacterium gordonae]
MPRPGASSSRHRRLSMKLPRRLGASRKSRALRDGGVSLIRWACYPVCCEELQILVVSAIGLCGSCW